MVLLVAYPQDAYTPPTDCIFTFWCLAKRWWCYKLDKQEDGSSVLHKYGSLCHLNLACDNLLTLHPSCSGHARAN